MHISTTFRQFHLTIVAVILQWVLIISIACICSLRCPACNFHAPLFHLWSDWLLQGSSTLSQNGKILREKFLSSWSGNLLEKLTGSQLVKKYPQFSEPKFSLPQLLEPTTFPYPEPYQSSPPQIQLNLPVVNHRTAR